MDGAEVLHSTKRRAEDNLEGDQRLAKRLSLLDLGRTGVGFISGQRKQSPQQATQNGASSDELMQIDDTKDRVFVSTLDDDPADSEREGQEGSLVFLADIERRLTRIPRSLLTNPSAKSTTGELVLYGIPSSLSVPEEHDNVRRAIIETRARAREKQAQLNTITREGNTTAPASIVGVENASTSTSGSAGGDTDAMDIG
ncbi:MAG: hypothetical protein M1832_001751 [Thelocarpon impressellum]|nr:MAG: hypothetical protein M1832_001751 [Thelocarpon impressellum]